MMMILYAFFASFDKHDNRDEDEDDDEGGLRVIGTTCAHNIASVIVVVVKLCCVLSVT